MKIRHEEMLGLQFHRSGRREGSGKRTGVFRFNQESGGDGYAG